MLEVEAKLRPAAPRIEALRARLEALAGAPRLRQQSDTYFHHPSRDLKARDEALRLRCDDGLAITWKGPKLDPPLKTREEIEFGLDTDLATATRLLEALGFSPVATVEKEREEWTLATPTDASICIDRVLGLGTFVEVEVQADDAGKGRVQVESLLAELDLADCEPVATSYLGLLLAAL